MSRRLGRAGDPLLHSHAVIANLTRAPDLIAMEDQVLAVVRNAAGFPLSTGQVAEASGWYSELPPGAAPAHLVCVGPARRRWAGPSRAHAGLAQRLLEAGMSVGSSRAAPEGALVEVDLRAPVRLAGVAGDGRLLLARAADVAAQSRPSPKTRRDYAGIYNRLIRWLANGLGRAPYLEDLTIEVLLAWRNHVRVLLRQLGMHEVAAELTTEGHRPAPPDTITPEGYDRLLRMPDRRRRLGVRDQTVLRILGDTGLRSAELRGLCVRHVERARTDSRHRRLRIVRGKGGRGRLVELTAAADAALDNWLARHPDARGVGGGRRRPPEDAPLFCTLGRGGHDPGRPLSAAALNRLAARHAKAAGIAAHLRHPT